MSDDFRELFEYVKAQRAIDFSVYRPSTIRRRLEIRFSATRTWDYASYNKYIRENPMEIDALIDALTIKVSCFFRNPFMFEALREIVLPELLDACRNDVLRIWCAGCARGEEPYSVAILLKEIMGKEALSPKVFIIGTDINRESLEDAKKAVYSPDSMLDVKKDYLDKYFMHENGQYTLKKEISSMVTFSYHDVTTSTAPKEGVFSDYHLILCRNVLIYFNRNLSERILNGFSGFVLRKGYLVLGEAESLTPQMSNEYEEVVQRTKIYRRK